MRKLGILIAFLCLIAVPVSAMDYTAPKAPEEAEALMPVDTESFGEGLWKVVTSAVAALQPDIADAAQVCLSLVAVVILVSLLKAMPGSTANVLKFAGVLAIAALLLSRTSSMISVAADTVKELSEYGKLLVPIMTAALAAQGGTASSAALYTGTAVFDAVLSAGITKLLIPLVYLFLALSIAASATGEPMLGRIKGFVKWLMTWSLKIILYIFTGYMGVTGVVSGSADAAAVKATKLTMSGMIPVVGGILSDASEAVIVGAGVMKSAVGVYGLLAVIAIWIAPFLKIGVLYLLLKLTAALCEAFDVKSMSDMINSFSTAMGFLLGMTGSICILLLISTVCFMKGVG